MTNVIVKGWMKVQSLLCDIDCIHMAHVMSYEDLTPLVLWNVCIVISIHSIKKRIACEGLSDPK